MDKNQELEELYDTVAQLYFKNIQFLEQQYPMLYSKIKAFEALKEENYFLEFINNHFELMDIKGKTYYNCNPFFDAQQRCRNLEEKPAFNLIKTKKIEQTLYHKGSINAFEYINEYLNLPQNNLAKNFEKFIFLGTLLGVHLNDLNKVLHSCAYLIYEENIEIFRLSLFLCDYEELNKNARLFFCINENQNSTNRVINGFLKYKVEYNHQIKFEVADENSISYIDTLTKIFVDYDLYNYPFSEYLISLKRAFYYKQHATYGILNCKTKHKILNLPILFLGAGPSLALSGEWIKLHQDVFIIVCVAACLRRLELLDIVPDIILSSDGQENEVLRQFEVDSKYYENSLMIASTKTNTQASLKFNSLNTFYRSSNIELFENNGFFVGVTVGDTGLDLLLRLGACEVYMLGLDACVSKSGETHDSIYFDDIVKIKEINVLQNEGINTKEDLIKVKGNFEEEVLTFMFYRQMIESIGQITANNLKSVNIYNLSNGAYFNNTIALEKEKIVWDKFTSLNKSVIQEELKNAFIGISSKTMTQKDNKDIKLEQKILKKLKAISSLKIDQEINKLKSTYANSLCLQIIEKFFDLIKPYSTLNNSLEAKELEYKQFTEIVEELSKIYQQ